MRELFKEAAKITNYNLILVVPLIIFILVIDLYSMFSRYSIDSNPKLLLASITILFMFGVFCAGWFYMVGESLKLSKKVFVLDKDRARASMNLFKCIPEGIGKFFLSFVGVYIIFFLIQILATPVVYLIGVKLIGGLDNASLIQLQQMALDPSMSTDAGIAKFVDSLSMEQILFFAKWSLLFMVATSFFMYLLMLWVPEIIYKTHNPFIALYKSIVKLFKDFIHTFGIYISLWLMGFLLLFLNTFAIFNPVAYMLVNMLLFYFFVYFVVLIFLYYDKKYGEE